MSSTLKILHLLNGSDAGGLSQYVLNLSIKLRDAGHHVILAGQTGAWHNRFVDAGLEWIEIPLQGGWWSMRQCLETLRTTLDLFNVNLIHTHYRKSTLLGRKLQQEALRQDMLQYRPRIPLLYTLHLSHIPLNWGRRLLSDFGDHTHIASEDARSWLLENKLQKPDVITLIPHGIHVNDFPVPTEEQRLLARNALSLKPTDIVAAYIGRLDYPKNEQWLIELAERSKSTLPNLKIILAGDGPHEQQVRATVRKRKLQDRVLILGHREPLPILHASDAALLPSEREGFSYSTVEALCTGIPVLRTRTSGTTETIIENVTGRSCDINRASFISSALEFLSDPVALAQMGRTAATHVRENLTFEKQLQATLQLYQSLQH